MTSAKPVTYAGEPVNCGNARRLHAECQRFHDNLFWDTVSGQGFESLDACAREFLMKQMRRPCAKVAGVAKRCAKGKKK